MLPASPWKALRLKTSLPVFHGLTNRDLGRYINEGRDFLYLDHSYFKRSPYRFRLIRGDVHLTRLLKRPPDRRLPWKLAPWREGKNVIVIPPSEMQVRQLGVGDWLEQTLKSLATDRPVIVKQKRDGPLNDFLRGAHCMVTYGSAAGIEAAVAGVPVFSGPRCPTAPISAGSLEDIEKPYYAENREEWLCSLGYACWTMEEVGSIDLTDYDYSRIHDGPKARA